MPLPDFELTGDLPSGVYPTTLAEVVGRFGSSSDRRKLLAARLQRIYRIARQNGSLARFVVFGSFVTAKDEPNDVDVFMVMDDNLDVGGLSGEASNIV